MLFVRWVRSLLSVLQGQFLRLCATNAMVCLLFLVARGNLIVAGETAATTAARNDASLDQELLGVFRQTYVLADGEVLACFAPPYLAGRLVYYRRTHSPGQVDAAPDGPDDMYFHWDGKGRVQGGGIGFGRATLRSVIPMLVDFQGHEIEGDQELLRTPIHADWIVRNDAPAEKVLTRLEEVLQSEFGLSATLTVRNVEREVIVAKGDYRFSPVGDANRIEIYGKVLTSRGGGGGSGDVDKFLNRVGWFINRRMVNGGVRASETRLRWHYNWRSPRAQFEKEDKDQTGVLSHLTEQTGLTFSKERRSVRTLFVERPH